MSQDTLVAELVAERATGMPGPPPVPVESPAVKRARLLRLARELRRDTRSAVRS